MAWKTPPSPPPQQVIRQATRAAETHRPAPVMPRSTPDTIRKLSDATYNTTKRKT